MRRFPLKLSWLVALTLAACSDDAAGDASLAATPQTKAEAEFIAMPDGAPEEVLWDDKKQRLLIVDNTGNRVWQWTDASGIADKPVATCALPEGEAELPANVTLGQATLLADGTLVVTRFGVPGADAAYGGIVVVHPNGDSELVPNLDASVHRLGIVSADDNTIYAAGFAAHDGMATGRITKVDLEKGETPVADGFGKLIGLAIVKDHLYVSDQSQGLILDAALDELPEHAEDWHTFATIAKPDQICSGPDDALFSGQFQAAMDSTDPIAVRQIAKDGSVSILRADPDVSKPSGVSYDATHKRLFVADTGNVAKIGIHVFPVK